MQHQWLNLTTGSMAALACVLALTTPSWARESAPAAGALTAQTRAMGGPRPAEEMALSIEHLDLSVKLLPRQKRIEGRAVLTLRASAAAHTLILDLYPGYRIDAIEVDGQRLDAGAYGNPQGQLRIRLPVPLAAGDQLTASIVYAGSPPVAELPPWHGGIVWSQAPDGQPWVGMSEWGVGCDVLYPCIDEPSRRIAVADLHYTVPAPLVAPGNGTFEGMTEKDGWRTYHWRARRPHVWGIVLNAGPFKLFEAAYKSRYGNEIPLRFWYLPADEAKAGALFREFPSILDFFESRIGPYPSGDQKMGVVQSPYEGMENQTINSYGDHFKKTPYGYDFVLQHEFSHEYFANIFLANYDDIWMHEGFGSFMQPLYGQWLHGDMDYYAMLAEARTKLVNRAPLVTGRDRTVEEVYFDKGGAAGDVYSKGELVAYALRNLIGDKHFFDSLRLLIYGRTDPRPGNYTSTPRTTRDYVKIVSDLEGHDMSWFFDVYLYHAALPQLLQTRHGNTLQLAWKTPDDLPFPMPVDVRVGSRTVVVPMTNGQGSVEVPAGESVTVDPGSKLLRQSTAIDDYQRWRSAQSPPKPAAQP